MTPTTFLIYGKQGSFRLLYTSPRGPNSLWSTDFSPDISAGTNASVGGFSRAETLAKDSGFSRCGMRELTHHRLAPAITRFQFPKIFSIKVSPLASRQSCWFPFIRKQVFAAEECLD
jgi:hypothetical protein